MKSFLALQATYTGIELGVYDVSVQIRATSIIEKAMASAYLFPLLQETLTKAEIGLDELTFIGANQGPAPFTTLRVALASINGIAFARAIPLVAVDGLRALLTQESTSGHATNVALLNAFNNDCYYAIATTEKLLRGCLAIEQILELIQRMHPTGAINFFGNGAVTFAELIKKQLGPWARIKPEAAQFSSLNTIALQAHANYLAGQTTTCIEPLYLKRSV